MPMGISSASGHFQCCMTRVLRGEYGRIVAIYIDDLIVFGSAWDECWHNTMHVLQVITRAGLAVNSGKATLCQTKAKVLGHVVDGASQTITPNPAKVSPLLHMQPTTRLKEVQLVFGQLN